ncbi:hydroxyacid dehydrogenase [Agromyces albus]|uniref:Hydroxyacid dehydrogenase n=1 Tax=Agromyces albus TaxID=205332 RepID=A0A4Q2KTW1_9MICO|nr:hydroxyacid dehydrogenase [Agromyces albus]RXZ67143.1 hydroxyacid dehydrogenase [Agromyces albus]
MIEYAVAVGSNRLAERLFGSSFEGLADVPAERVGGVLTEFESDVSRRVLARADALLTGWDTPPLTAAALDAAPRLRHVIHAGGAVEWLFPDGGRGIEASDTGAVNATPVAEYALAMVLLANKDAFRARELYRDRRAYIDREEEFEASGNHIRTVGVVSASRTGRALIELLRPFATLRVLVYDPYLGARDAHALGVESVTLAQLMRSSDVVTLHPPVLPDTIGMISEEMLALLPDGATLINTARGEIVDQAALERELRSRRIKAILDVSEPEPLPASSPLYDLPNVFLTPHIAGSMGTELRRMGDEVAAILTRFAGRERHAQGAPLG